MPEEVWSKLDAILVERPYRNEDEFRTALARILDEGEMRRWGNLVLAVAKPRRFSARGYEREYQAEPVSEEARRLWDEEELRYFRENGSQLYLPKSFSTGAVDQDGNPVKLKVLSRWLRIPALRGYGVDQNLTPEQRALLGLP
jgi:hypothetical protein